MCRSQGNKMKGKALLQVVILVMLTASCAPETKIVLTETTIPSPTFAPITITPTATLLGMNPAITATPLNLAVNANNIRNVIMLLHPVCAEPNLGIETPPPQDVPIPYPLKFTKVNNPPDPKLYDYEEIADN